MYEQRNRSSDESWLAAASSPSDLAAEEELKKGLKDQPGMTTNQIWECLHLSEEWDAYVKGRRAGNLGFELPIFRAFYRLKRKTDRGYCLWIKAVSAVESYNSFMIPTPSISRKLCR